MTKRELVEALAARAPITKLAAESVVDAVFGSMTAAFARGEGVEIRGFGSFAVRSYGSYSGRNPKTGEAITVPPKRAPYFKPGKELKALVNANRHVPLEAEEEDEAAGDEEVAEEE